MKVAEVMSRGIEPLEASATVQAAAVYMAEYDVGAVLVGTSGSVEGILTDRDIILRVVVDGRSPAEVTVGEVMSSSVFSCHPEDSIEATFSAMRERQVRRMPVLDEGGHPIGIVTLSDVARSLGGSEQIQETLREISEPHRVRQATPAALPPGNPPAASGGAPVEASPVA